MSFKLSALAWNVEVDKSADRLVLLALASKADDNGRNCFPSVESICGLTVLNRKTVFAVISRLADRGLITVRKRVSTNSNEYLLHVDRWTENGSAENGTTQKGDNPKTVQRSSQKRDDGSAENGTTQKGDNPKTVQRSSQKRDDGSTENGTLLYQYSVRYSVNYSIRELARASAVGNRPSYQRR